MVKKLWTADSEITWIGQINQKFSHRNGTCSFSGWQISGFDFWSNRFSSGLCSWYAAQKITRITENGKYNVSPSWSLMGNSLLMQVDRWCFLDLQDWSEIQENRVTPKNMNAESPTWSPDGSMIAFSGKKEEIGKSIIYLPVVRRFVSLIPKRGFRKPCLPGVLLYANR